MEKSGDISVDNSAYIGDTIPNTPVLKSTASPPPQNGAPEHGQINLANTPNLGITDLPLSSSETKTSPSQDDLQQNGLGNLADVVQPSISHDCDGNESLDFSMPDIEGVNNDVKMDRENKGQKYIVEESENLQGCGITYEEGKREGDYFSGNSSKRADGDVTEKFASEVGNENSTNAVVRGENEDSGAVFEVGDFRKMMDNFDGSEPRTPEKKCVGEHDRLQLDTDPNKKESNIIDLEDINPTIEESDVSPKSENIIFDDVSQLLEENSRPITILHGLSADSGTPVRYRKLSLDHSKNANGIDNKAFENTDSTKYGSAELSKRVPLPGDEEKRVALLSTTTPDGSPATQQKTAEDDQELDPDMYCGIGACKPKALQKCKSMICFTGVYSLAGIVTSALSAYITSQITTLERHFNFSSSVSGFLMSCNDLGYLITTLFFSYYTRKLHIPRALAISTIVYGISGLICTLPFFGTRDQIPAPPPVVREGGNEGLYAMIKFPAKMCTSEALNMDKIAALAKMAGMGHVEGMPNLEKLAELAKMADEAGMSPGATNMPSMANIANNPGALSALNMTSIPNMPAMGNMLSNFMNSTGGFTPIKNLTCAQLSGGGGAILDISEGWRSAAVVLIAVGMIIQGVAKSPRQSFLATYVDDNVPKTKTTMYLGTMVGLSIFGPALAFVLGGVFTTMYITLEETSMTPMDPRFIGAWWMGFLMFGSISLVVGIPIMFFPRRLRKQKELMEIMRKEKMARIGKSRFLHEAKSILKCLFRLAINPIYVCTVLANGLHLMGISGLIAFMPKYLETQFTIPAWKANIIIGALNVASASAGTIFGGCLTSRLKLSPMRCLILMVVSSLVSSGLLSIGFALGCDQPHIIGMGQNTSSLSTCTTGCDCVGASYFPVCGADGQNYFSPCHAGCKTFGTGFSFANCSCLASTGTNISEPVLGTATAGLCSPECGNLYPYSLLAFFSAFFATLCIMPSFIVSIRSVGEADKPFAMGFSAFAGTLLGWFPGPVIFGALVDTTCLLWTGGQCGGYAGRGACKLYDLNVFRVKYHALLIGLRGVNLLILSFALFLALFTNCVKFQAQTDEIEVSSEKVIGAPEDKKNEESLKEFGEGKKKEDTLEATWETKA